MASATKEYTGFFLSHLQPVDAKCARYENNTFIGKGGNGTAFLVTCVSGVHCGTQFVLKVLHKTSETSRIDAFRREIEIMKKLKHPCTVRVYDDGVFTAGDREFPFMISEYLPRNARELISRNEINRLKGLRIIMNCLSALCALGKENIVHRDIKPENIFLAEHIAKLGDFGLVKIQNQDQLDEMGKEMTTQMPGMPFFYRTPELVRKAKGEKIEITPASDIFQFGTVIYELLTGYNPQRRPEKVTDKIELDLRNIEGNNSVAIYEMVERCLDFSPQKTV